MIGYQGDEGGVVVVGHVHPHGGVEDAVVLHEHVGGVAAHVDAAIVQDRVALEHDLSE